MSCGRIPHSLGHGRNLLKRRHPQQGVKGPIHSKALKEQICAALKLCPERVLVAEMMELTDTDHSRMKPLSCFLAGRLVQW